MPDLVQTIQKIGEEVIDFRAKYDGRIANVEKQLGSLETAVARGQYPYGGGSSRAGVDSEVSREHRKAFSNFLRSGVVDGLKDLEIRAAVTTFDDPSGGWGVPQEIDELIEKTEREQVAMRKIATVKKVMTSDYKKLVSVGGSSSGWVTEAQARPETTSPILKQVAPIIGELYASPAITQTAIDDIGFDAIAWLGEEIANEFGEQEAEAFIKGNGVGKPKGILSYTTSALGDATRPWGELQHIAGGHASLFNNVDKLLTLVHSVKSKYRTEASWIMNSTTLETIRKFKDGDGNYIWRPGLEMAQPSMLLGFAVHEESNMDDVGANTLPIAFGNFRRGYLIVDRTGTRVVRDNLTNKPFVYLYTTKRLGGACVNFEAIKFLKISVA